jgi:hypothetical protein
VGHAALRVFGRDGIERKSNRDGNSNREPETDTGRLGLLAPVVVATGVGWAVGGVLLSACIGGLGDELGNVAGNAALGLLVGIGQWLVLRQWLERAGWWVLASAGGWLLAVSVGEVLQGVLGENLGGLILTIGLGLVPGVLQWLVLRQQAARAGWWVLASTVFVFAALLVGAGTASGVGLEENGIGYGVVAGIAGGVVFGSTSGLVLGWLLRRPVAAPARTQATA